MARKRNGEPTRSEGERSEPQRSVGSPAERDPPPPADPVDSTSPAPPDPEVPEKPRRRRFTAEYKQQILERADALKDNPGGIGALLRSEGLYSSHLTSWRRQREDGVLWALSPKKRGRKAQARNPLAPRVAELEAETARLRRRLQEAEMIIEVQKKLSALLGLTQEEPEENGKSP